MRTNLRNILNFPYIVIHDQKYKEIVLIEVELGLLADKRG